MKLFITGTMRSGTTLLTHMLNQHPDLRVTYDSVHFMRFGYMKFGKGQLTHEAAQALADSINERLTGRFRKGFDTVEFGRRMTAIASPDYSTAYDLIMQLYLGHSNWGEKTVLQWRSAGDILGMFEDIHMVHCVRDPRDVLSSWKNKTIAPGVDYLDAIGNCFDSMKYARENQIAFNGRYHVVQYEKIAASPAESLEQLCASLGIHYNKSMIDTSGFKNKVTQEQWEPNTAFGDVNEGISKSPIGRWATHLPAEDLLLCELVNRELMGAFNYALSPAIGNASIRDVYQAMAKLAQSPLALNGVLGIIQSGEGVQRNPLNENDPKTWVTDVRSL